jgi:NADPH:quinone reductase-like Zn-dependent oxidoreductase
VRAARFHHHGDPSVLQVDDVPAPRAPTGDEILVRVLASSINGTDTGLRAGRARIATVGRLPFVPGFDLAGDVVACGPAVTAFAPGDRVMALLGHGGGGQAERVLLRQRRAALAPRSVPVEAAAALPLAGLTALQALHGRAALSSRQHTGRQVRVLVNGASGGIGCYGVQLAKLAGAHVTGVTSGPKREFVTGLGADEVVDYQQQAVAHLGTTFDVVLDVTGRLTLAEARPVLAAGGVLVSTLPVHPDALRALVPRPLRRTDQHFTAVATRARSQDLARLAALVDSGRLRAPVDRTFPLAEIAAAHRHVETAVRGKTVVTM